MRHALVLLEKILTYLPLDLTEDFPRVNMLVLVEGLHEHEQVGELSRFNPLLLLNASKYELQDLFPDQTVRSREEEENVFNLLAGQLAKLAKRHHMLNFPLKKRGNGAP